MWHDIVNLKLTKNFNFQYENIGCSVIGGTTGKGTILHEKVNRNMPIFKFDYARNNASNEKILLYIFN